MDYDIADNLSPVREWVRASITAHDDKSSTMLEINSARPFLRGWLASVLDDISLRLRRAGWEKDDIEEIMKTKTAKSDGSSRSRSRQPCAVTSLTECSDKQSVLDFLSRQARTFSSAMRNAGWSTMDVADALGFEVTDEFGCGGSTRRRKMCKLDQRCARPSNSDASGYASRTGQVCRARAARRSIQFD